MCTDDGGETQGDVQQTRPADVFAAVQELELLVVASVLELSHAHAKLPAWPSIVS